MTKDQEVRVMKVEAEAARAELSAEVLEGAIDDLCGLESGAVEWLEALAKADAAWEYAEEARRLAEWERAEAEAEAEAGDDHDE